MHWLGPWIRIRIKIKKIKNVLQKHLRTFTRFSNNRDQHLNLKHIICSHHFFCVAQYRYVLNSSVFVSMAEKFNPFKIHVI
jgi:hypothetical protein